VKYTQIQIRHMPEAYYSSLFTKMVEKKNNNTKRIKSEIKIKANNLTKQIKICKHL